MIVPQVIDLDWLHSATEVIRSGQYRYRAIGKTVAYLHLMLGEYECGDSRNAYLYVGHSSRQASDAMFDFLELVRREYGDDAADKEGQYTITTSRAQRFYFFSLPLLVADPSILRSKVIDRVFFDVDDASQQSYDREGKLQDTFSAILPTLKLRRGDVI